jgi:hypothetical protein
MAADAKSGASWYLIRPFFNKAKSSKIDKL